jgi:hypothetical protein
MLDADMSIPAAWRLRAAVARMVHHCAARPADGMCMMAIDMPAFLDGTRFHTLRLFPTPGVGTAKGWRYMYPVHEVGTKGPPESPLPMHFGPGRAKLWHMQKGWHCI